MSFDAMGLLVLRHATPCNGMECSELKMPLVARPRRVVRSGSVTMR